MRVVITGGAGFIGTNFVRYMLKAHPKYDIVVLDSLTYAGIIGNIKGLPIGFKCADIRDTDDMVNIVHGAGYVVNFAAESHVDRSITDPMTFLDTNVMGTASILEACKWNKVPLLHISTDEVYGDLTPDDPAFTEETSIKPSSPYSASKAAADLLCQSYVRTYRSDIKITRSSNNYGPYQFPEKMIPVIITKALADAPIPVYGEGLNIRDWLYVEDNCRAIDTVIHKGKSGEVYNVGGDGEMTNIELVKKILKIMDKPESLITYVTDRPGHDLRYAINHDKLSKLGWQPLVGFEEGIRRTIDWYRSR